MKKNAIGETQIFKMVMAFFWMKLEDERKETGQENYSLFIRAKDIVEARDIAYQWSKGSLSVEIDNFLDTPLPASTISSKYDGDTIAIEIVHIEIVASLEWTLDLTYDVYLDKEIPATTVHIGSIKSDSTSAMVEFIDSSISLQTYAVETPKLQNSSLFLNWGGVCVRALLQVCPADRFEEEPERNFVAKKINELFAALVSKGCKIENPGAFTPTSIKAPLNDVYGSDSSFEVTVDCAPWGIFIKVEGHGNAESDKGEGHILSLENRNGALMAMAWEDMHNSYPTLEVSFESAQECHREHSLQNCAE